MKKAISVLEQEATWHKNNKDKAKRMSDDKIEGFVKGCEHCISVLAMCETTDQMFGAT